MNSPEIDEQSEADVFSNLPSRNDSSAVKRNHSSSRSKHSETEQRRRSKINERFQNLMDIIPQNQNDQKRDKASFLLEVIEYIHFLQEKVQMYEGSNQIWHQTPTKLIPWRNNHESVVEVSDHPQIVKRVLSNDKTATSSYLFPNMQNSVDSVIDSAVSTKILERNPVSAFSSCIPPGPLVQFVQHDFSQPKQCSGSFNSSRDKLLNLDEKISASLSTVYSQRVLHSVTEALKSSGVNMSETKISVQLGLRKRTDHEYSLTAFASEDNCNSTADEEEDSPIETGSFCKELDHYQKRIRRQRS